MKSKNLCALTLALTVSLGAQAQQNNSGASSAQNSGQNLGQNSGQNSGQNPSQNLPPGLQRRDQLPPGLDRRDNLPPGLAKRNQVTTNGVGAVGATNDLSAGNLTNGLGSATNTFGMRGTNSQLYGTNSMTASARQDQAKSVSDQRLLVQIRRSVTPYLRISSQTPAGTATTTTTTTSTSTAAALPVYFSVQQNVVTLLGTVATPAQKQQIATVVQRTPGVVRVVNQLQVNADVVSAMGAGASTGETAIIGGGGIGTNNATAGTSLTNDTRFEPTSGTYATTNRIYGQTNYNRYSSTNRTGLPPGLQNRQQLPPGLQNREQLPPGLDRRVNTNTNQ